jgi:hypothetical protein
LRFQDVGLFRKYREIASITEKIAMTKIMFAATKPIRLMVFLQNSGYFINETIPFPLYRRNSRKNICIVVQYEITCQRYTIGQKIQNPINDVVEL